MRQKTNSSIGCTVTQCKYHDSSDYCTLDQIQVISNNTASDDNTTEVTDCGSYEKQ